MGGGADIEKTYFSSMQDTELAAGIKNTVVSCWLLIIRFFATNNKQLTTNNPKYSLSRFSPHR